MVNQEEMGVMNMKMGMLMAVTMTTNVTMDFQNSCKCSTYIVRMGAIKSQRRLNFLRWTFSSVCCRQFGAWLPNPQEVKVVLVSALLKCG